MNLSKAGSVFIAMALGACSAGAQLESNTPTKMSSETLIPPASITAAPVMGSTEENTTRPAEASERISQWVTYDDPYLEVSFRHPPQWFVYPVESLDSGERTILSSFDLESHAPDELGTTYTKEQIRIEVGVHPFPYLNSESLSAWGATHFLGQEDTILGEKVVTIGQYDGVRMEVEDTNGSNWVVLFVDRGHRVLIVWGTQSPLTDLMLSTLVIE